MIYGEYYQFSKTLVKLFSNVIIPIVTCGKLGFAFLASVYKVCRQLCISHSVIMSRYCGEFLYSANSPTQSSLALIQLHSKETSTFPSYMCLRKLSIGVFFLQRSNHAVNNTSTFHDIGERVLVRVSSPV